MCCAITRRPALCASSPYLSPPSSRATTPVLASHPVIASPAATSISRTTRSRHGTQRSRRRFMPSSFTGRSAPVGVVRTCREHRWATVAMLRICGMHDCRTCHGSRMPCHCHQTQSKPSAGARPRASIISQALAIQVAGMDETGLGVARGAP